MKNYQEQDVLNSLRTKEDVRIKKPFVELLYGPRAKRDVGKRTKGKIDFLQHKLGYHVRIVNHFTINS